MPIDLTEQKIDYGKVHFQWEFPEYESYERTKKWYGTAVAVFAALLLYALLTFNILFAVIIFLFSVIIIFLHRKEPKLLGVKITDEGIVIESKLYRYDEIKSFWIVYELPRIKNLYFEFKSWALPRLAIPYLDQDPNRLRAFLLQYIDENTEREGEPISDSIGRWLKL